jgi:hypothetical protein
MEVTCSAPKLIVCEYGGLHIVLLKLCQEEQSSTMPSITEIESQGYEIVHGVQNYFSANVYIQVNSLMESAGLHDVYFGELVARAVCAVFCSYDTVKLPRG